MEQSTNRDQSIMQCFETFPDPVAWYRPVYAPSGFLVNFKLEFVNQALIQAAGVADINLVGKNLDEVRKYIPFETDDVFMECTTAYSTGKVIESQGGAATRVTRWYLSGGVISLYRMETAQHVFHAERERDLGHLQAILDASLSGICSLYAQRDESGNIVDFTYAKVNSMFERLTGRKASEVEGKSYLAFYPNANTHNFFDRICDVVQTGKPTQFEVDYRADGLDGWFEASISPFGKNGVVISFADVTARKMGQLQIERQERILDSILRQSPAGIAVIKLIHKDNIIADGHVIIMNEVTEKLTGIPMSRLQTETLESITPGFTQTETFQRLKETHETGIPSQLQHYLEPTDKWLEVSLAKFDDNHVIAVYSDVTARKKDQARLEQLVDHLKRSNTQLEEFAWAASHDLKEPLRKIDFYLDRIVNEHLQAINDEGQATLLKLANAASRMKRLVNDLLSFSQLNNTPQFDTIDLNEVVSIALSDLEIPIKSKHARIHVDNLPFVLGHQRQMEQLFINLIGNALKYSQQHAMPEIAITHVDQEQWHCIDVRDNGIGFDESNSDKIFRIFQRLHHPTEYEGTGVGLTIVRKIVENHSGEIQVKSKPGVGTTFRLLFPKT